MIRGASDIPVPISPLSPRAEYERRLTARQEKVRQHQRKENLAGQMRVATFLGILVAAYSLWNIDFYFPLGLLLASAAFVSAVVWHRRVVHAWDRSLIAVGYYTRAIARLDDRWIGIGPGGESYCRPEHLYAGDIDLFGRGSLFQLLCTARTRMGQDTLAAWLLHPADPETIRSRQSAIEELRNNLDLREELAVIDAPLGAELNPSALLEWAAAPSELVDRARPLLALLLALLATLALGGWIFFGLGLGWLGAVVVFQVALLWTMRRQIRNITRNIDAVLANLNLLVEILRIMEAQKCSSPLLRKITEKLTMGKRLPSERVFQLTKLAGYWDTIRQNQLVAPFAFLWMLMVQLAYAIERWRTTSRPLITEWLQAVGEFEALNSLAAYAYEHPEYLVPEILEDGPRMEVQELGHPLIPARCRVTNEVSLDAGRQMLLVSGSNMSGKSTLLRAVGINVAIALAGGPVCAARMRVSPLALASAMRTVDSLQEGVSAFYAEIQRLRAVCNLTAGNLPVLFLLDEILHGTNSHDRRAGAEVIIGSLLKDNAIGLITTHDLALAEIADRLAPRAANVHFEDQIKDGRLDFDYRLRPGVVPKGNGLVLMRLLGFEV